jgi:uncharacterized NAD(P)/FAD-binding protein YdhS
MACAVDGFAADVEDPVENCLSVAVRGEEVLVTGAAAAVTICIVGAGPRGLSLLERICANSRESGIAAAVHLVDPYPAGAGRVWQSSQSRHLLMNTVAHQISVFTDPSVIMAGPVEPGLTVYEWAKNELPGDSAECAADSDFLAEARQLQADDYPSRALYGRYLEWAYRLIVRGAPPQVSVVVHRCKALALYDAPQRRPDGELSQTLRLDDGLRLEGLDAVILAQGHLPVRGSGHERSRTEFAVRHGLTYLPAANPAELDLSSIRAGEPTLLCGLGLAFFDLMALLTVGRGGSFEQAGAVLAYRPSGREPQLFAGSRRGIPYHARGSNQKGQYGRHNPTLLSAERIEELRARAERADGLDFRTEVWPLISREVETTYYCALLQEKSRAAEVEPFQLSFLGAFSQAQAQQLLDQYGIDPADRWDWQQIALPHSGRRFSGPSEFTSWLLDYLQRDVIEAHRGNVTSPLKAALDVLRDIRNEVRLVVDHSGLHGRSHQVDLDGWYTPLNAYLSIGPPASRIEELIALIRAGIIRVVGPGLRVTADEAAGVFVAESPQIPDSEVRATALIEARIADISLSRTADPLLRQLLDSGQCKPYQIRNRDSGSFQTDGMAVTERPFRIIDAAGHPHPSRFVLGVPTESVHWATAAGIRPGVNSVTLADSDAIARAALACGQSQSAPLPVVHQ